jgi:3-hydroxyisobutyrate dehydrogenase
MVEKAVRVGWIGTGVMGKSMAGHLMKKGYSMSVFNRTASKADELVSNGATFMPAIDVAKQSDYVFLMLGYPHDVEKMVLCPDQGILQHMKPGSYLIDHTTSSPDLASRIAAKALETKVHSIDAPVSGGDIGAKNGKLVTMVGGAKEAVDACRPLMDCYSAEVQNMGKPGAGQHTKAANQIMIATTMIGVCESLIYSHKAGLDINQMINLLSKGAAGSFSLEKLAPRMLRRDFEPGFYVEHFVKDLGICLDEAKRMNISLPGLALAQQFYHALVAQGGARMGTQGLLTTLEKFNNTEIRKYDI